MPETDPSITPVCRACGADAMIPNAFLIAKGYGGIGVQVGVNRNPEAKLMKRPVTVDAEVSVCGECGAVQMNATEPHKLWEAYAESLSRGWE